MAIQLYDTLTRSKIPFQPLVPGQVSMYVCGPTVYSDCHVGHLMGPVLFDAVARWLTARNYQVRFVNNITDIDDKIINRSQSSGEAWEVIAERYTAQYLDLIGQLGVTTITDHPRCTAYIPDMLTFIGKLIDDDRAYAAADGVYYDVSKQNGYGKLSGRKLEDMRDGEAAPGLRNAADFALWKAAKAGEPSWDSPWGAGRPGWHLECSVMAGAILGDAFDIHGGGDDLKFPHHENEIAQSEACGCSFAKAWMHNGLIQYGGAKVSKSDPRMQDAAFSLQFQAKWLLEHYGPATIRFFLLQGHYRRPFDFEPTNIDNARTALKRLFKQFGPLLSEHDSANLDDILARDLAPALTAKRDAFCAAMDDDFHTGKAISELFGLAGYARKPGLSDDERDSALRLIRDLGRLLGLFQPGDEARLGGDGQATSAGDDSTVATLMELIISLRGDARAQRDFATADRIRDQLDAAGIIIKDGADGATWERR
ncbi:MAG: cysteine--tRNA ligase [Planctomycetota bacterium]